MSKKRQYGIFDGDELLATGSSAFILGTYGIYPHRYAYTGELYRKKYTVKRLGLWVGNKILSDKIEVKKDKKEMIENSLRSMKLYGNTYADDPELYREILETNGIRFTYRPCMDGHGYILERIY